MQELELQCRILSQTLTTPSQFVDVQLSSPPPAHRRGRDLTDDMQELRTTQMQFWRRLREIVRRLGLHRGGGPEAGQ